MDFFLRGGEYAGNPFPGAGAGGPEPAKPPCRLPLLKNGRDDQTKPMTTPAANRLMTHVRMARSGTALTPGAVRSSGIRNNCTVAAVCDRRLIIKTPLIERRCIGREWCNFKPETVLGK
jgi:hypothetical protein